MLNYTLASMRGGIPPRLPRARRGGARVGPTGMDLLAEYDSRIHGLLQLTSDSAPGVAFGSCESRRV